jgi:hypothetical protein
VPPAPSSEDAGTTPRAATSGLHETLFVVWLVDSALLVFVLGYVFLHGNTPDLAELPRDLGAVWGVINWHLKAAQSSATHSGTDSRPSASSLVIRVAS